MPFRRVNTTGRLLRTKDGGVRSRSAAAGRGGGGGAACSGTGEGANYFASLLHCGALSTAF